MNAESSIPFTYEDYKSLPESRERYELMDGELYVSPVPTTTHQAVSQNIELILVQHVRANDLGRVLNAPVDVVLGEGPRRNVVQPDIVLVVRGRESIIIEAEIAGAPDLVIEILSPGTEERDRGLKKTLYACASVREYWIVDIERACIEVFEAGPSGYAVPRRCRPGDRVVSVVLPNLEVAVEDAFRRW